MRKFDDAFRYLQLITSTFETLNLYPRSTVHQNAATFELIRPLTMMISQTVQELSCWKTKQKHTTNRNCWKQPTSLRYRRADGKKVHVVSSLKIMVKICLLAWVRLVTSSALHSEATADWHEPIVPHRWWC